MALAQKNTSVLALALTAAARLLPDIHCISPPCCSVGISWRRRWRRSFHIARVAWSSSEPDVNTNGRTAMICMLDSARWRRLQPSQRRGRGWGPGGQRLDFLMLRQGGQRSTPKRCVYCMPGLLRWAKEREKEHGACNERRAKEAALPAATAPHLLHRHHFRSTLFTGLSDSSVSRWLVFMRYSVALEVMPHSATSRATGDDTSTIRTWNSGV